MSTRFTDPTEFLRELEQHGLENAFALRPAYTRLELNRMIRVERDVARQRELDWTNWRKFHCLEEAASPNRCMHWQPNARQPYCTVVAIYVSYHTRRPERLFLCTGHYLEEERRYQASLAAAGTETL